MKDLYLAVFVDANFGGDGATTSKNISGVFIAVVGPRTFWPILAASKRQVVVSHSSTESEATAVDTALRTEAISILHFLQQAQGMYENDANAAGGEINVINVQPSTSTSSSSLAPSSKNQTVSQKAKHRYQNAVSSAQCVGKPSHEAEKRQNPNGNPRI